jgi:aminoglycoside phosphotransferase (APT) family kinase protein
MPSRPSDLTPAFLSELISELHSGVVVESADITAVRNYGGADRAKSVSTSTQVSLQVRYREPVPPSLPTRLFAKMSIPDDVARPFPSLAPLYENEVTFYRRLRSQLNIEAPLAMGARFERATGHYVVLMEDLAGRAFHVNSMADAPQVAVVEALLDTYARLHASHWASSRFQQDLSWVQSQVEGSMETLFDGLIREHVVKELTRERFKQEFVEETGASEEELYLGEKALKRHYATLPQTFLHGDAHFANTYVLPDGTGGLLDFQVCARGFAMMDVGYILHSSLSVEARRATERELLAFYRDRLGHYGARDVPGLERLWTEYRRSAVHSFYLGWLTAPRDNYGWEICVLGNHRTKVAYQDLETRALVRQIL